MSDSSRKVALLFRYGAGEHLDFLPALPGLIRRLHQQGIEVHHFGFRGGTSLPQELTSMVQVHEGPFRVRRKSELDKRVKALLWIFGLPLLGRKLQRQGFDRVFVDETLPLSAPLLRLGYRGTLMFTVHDFFMEIYCEPKWYLRGLGRWIQSMDLKAWRGLDRIFTRVEAAKRCLGAQGVDPSRISVVPDPVDLQLFQPLKNPERREIFRKHWGIQTEDLVMVHHGIMHPNKGNLRLVEALARVRDRLPVLKLLLIGDGPEMKELQRVIDERHLQERVILTRWLPGMKDISEALQASDIGLVMRRGLPGDHFHVTSTLAHNMACGLPVLAVGLQGISEVVEDGVQGYMFDPVCGEDFDLKLIKLAENQELRNKMGFSARQKAQECFDPERIAGEYAQRLCD